MRRLIVNGDGGSEDEDRKVQEVDLDELLPDPPATFLTIVWSDSGHVVLNIGSLNYWSARGILEEVNLAFREWSPPVEVEGDSLDPSAWYEDDEDEDEEGEDG